MLIFKASQNQSFTIVLFFVEAFTFAAMQGFRKQIWFFIPLVVLISALGASLLMLSKAESFHFWNQLLPIPIGFWQIVTVVGDGLFAAALVVSIALFKNRSLAAAVLLSWLLGALFAQGLKNTVFKDEPRPVLWFQLHQEPLTVPTELKPHSRSSMPSGHTTTAIGVLGLFAWLTISSNKKFLFVTIACLAAISRIALYQHFPADVLLGVFLGLTTIAPSLYLQHFIRKRFPFVADKPFIKRR